MFNSMVVNLNLRNTIAEQDNKCLQCESELNPNKLYFRMDQAIHLYEVYCEICGIEMSKKDEKMIE